MVLIFIQCFLITDLNDIQQNKRQFKVWNVTEVLLSHLSSVLFSLNIASQEPKGSHNRDGVDKIGIKFKIYFSWIFPIFFIFYTSVRRDKRTAISLSLPFSLFPCTVMCRDLYHSCTSISSSKVIPFKHFSYHIICTLKALTCQLLAPQALFQEEVP